MQYPHRRTLLLVSTLLFIACQRQIPAPVSGTPLAEPAAGSGIRLYTSTAHEVSFSYPANWQKNVLAVGQEDTEEGAEFRWTFADGNVWAIVSFESLADAEGRKMSWEAFVKEVRVSRLLDEAAKKTMRMVDDSGITAGYLPAHRFRFTYRRFGRSGMEQVTLIRRGEELIIFNFGVGTQQGKTVEDATELYEAQKPAFDAILASLKM